MTEWNLPPGPPIVTDNASNMTVVAEELGTSLACGEALKITCESSPCQNEMSCGLFYRSAITAAILKEKQKLLLLPEYKLLVGVATRWNSALNMISWYLEQQPAIYAALTSKGTP